MTGLCRRICIEKWIHWSILLVKSNIILYVLDWQVYIPYIIVTFCPLEGSQNLSQRKPCMKLPDDTSVFSAYIFAYFRYVAKVDGHLISRSKQYSIHSIHSYFIKLSGTQHHLGSVNNIVRRKHCCIHRYNIGVAEHDEIQSSEGASSSASERVMVIEIIPNNK